MGSFVSGDGAGAAGMVVLVIRVVFEVDVVVTTGVRDTDVVSAVVRSDRVVHRGKRTAGVVGVPDWASQDWWGSSVKPGGSSTDRDRDKKGEHDIQGLRHNHYSGLDDVSMIKLSLAER